MRGAAPPPTPGRTQGPSLDNQNRANPGHTASFRRGERPRPGASEPRRLTPESTASPARGGGKGWWLSPAGRMDRRLLETLEEEPVLRRRKGWGVDGDAEPLDPALSQPSVT